jgi:hypothetical protein
VLGEDAKILLLRFRGGSANGRIAVWGDVSGHPAEPELDDRAGVRDRLSGDLMRRHCVALRTLTLRQFHRHSAAHECGQFDRNLIDRIRVGGR